MFLGDALGFHVPHAQHAGDGGGCESGTVRVEGQADDTIGMFKLEESFSGPDVPQDDCIVLEASGCQRAPVGTELNVENAAGMSGKFPGHRPGVDIPESNNRVL